MKYNKELFNRFLTKKVAIALRTQEEWNKFMELLEKETDLMWLRGKKPTELNCWEEYKEETVIIYNHNHSGLQYASVSFYKRVDYEIIEFKELVNDNEMNLADKLRFLADRWEDGKDFYMGVGNYSLNSGKLVLIPSGIDGEIEINHLEWLDLRLPPQWTFTEDEKAILRNLPEEYKWIVRDKIGDVFVWEGKPFKNNYCGRWIGEDSFDHLIIFNHLFQSIKWSDEEPCEFRKYI